MVTGDKGMGPTLSARPPRLHSHLKTRWPHQARVRSGCKGGRGGELISARVMVKGNTEISHRPRRWRGELRNTGKKENIGESQH